MITRTKDEDLDEETQLAMALSLSEAEEAYNRRQPSFTSALPRIPADTASDFELAKKLQEAYDRENSTSTPIPTSASSPHRRSNSNTSNNDRKNQPHVPTTLCAGCHQSLLTPPSATINNNNNNILGSLSKLLSPAVLQQPQRYITALDKKWHPQCFVCAHCHRPLASSFTIDPSGHLPMHPQCYKQQHHPKCSVCAEHLPEDGEGSGRIVWHVAPFWGDKTCPKHAQDGTMRCTSCHRLQPRSELWADLDDGRVLCLQCIGTVVPDTATAQPLYDSVLDFYKRMGMQLPDGVKPPLLLVEDSALNAASSAERRQDTPGGPVFHTRGLCITEYSQQVMKTYIPGMSLFSSARDKKHGFKTTLGPRRVSVTAILVLRGLPRLLSGAIIAHESMHAWLRLHHFPDLSPEVEEGLCQLMALLWLEGQKPEEASYEERLAAFFGHQIRTDQSYVYGDGLRAALEAYQRHGLPTVLANVRHARQLPA